MILLKNKDKKANIKIGNNIEIKDGSDFPFDLTLYGRSTQETTTGKNLFNSSNSIWAGNSAEKVNYDSTNDTFTFHRDSGSDYLVANESIKLKANTNYTLYINAISNTMTSDLMYINSSANLTGDNNRTLLTAGQTGIVRKNLLTGNLDMNYDLWLYCNSTGTLKAQIMLVEGVNDTSPYEPYTGGIPSPNPDYPSEIESIEGKNLCDVSTSQIGVGWNLTNNSARAICNVKVEPNTTYSLSFASISAIDGLHFCEKVNSTDTTIIDNVVQITANRQITTSSTTNYLVIQFNKSNISMSDIEAIKLQVEKGSIITGYVPYGTIQYKQIGDNIFNKNGAFIVSRAKKDVLDTGVKAIVNVEGNYRYVAIKLGGSELLGKKITIQTKITPSANNDGQLSLFYGTSTSLSSKYRIVDVNTTNPTNAYILNTFPDNFDTIWCCFYGNLTGIGNVGDYVDYTDVMIVMGDSIADGYKPYQETILNINLQGNKLCSLSNGVKDELVVENGRAKIIKNVQEDLLDGVNKKFKSIDMRGTKTFLICNYSNPNIKKATSENEVIPLSNKFRTTSSYNTWNGVVIYGISQAHNGTYLQFSFPKTISADLTLAGLNTWLASNNIKVQYQLETPIEIDLGEVTQPKTFEGVNNISNSEDTNMLINYYNAFEFDKILRSGYEIDEQENEIFKKKMANGHRKKIVSSYIDCIIKINLGLLDNKTYQEYKGQLEDGEYEYWSYKYNQYKKANFILTKPSITTEYAYDDEIGIDDMEITLEKSSDVS